MDDEPAVPPAARLLRDLVNTREPQVGAESLATPEQLRDWLASHRLVPPDARLDEADLTTATTLREGLRAVLLDHAGHASDPAAVVALNTALAQVPVRLVFTEGGHRFVAALDTPLAHAGAGIVDAVRQCAEDRTWVRLKVCARDTCRWAFFDSSRNQTRRWCSMAGCGNHVKMRRAYATRRARPPQTTATPSDAVPPVEA
ncbi:CGNR zinc finger domain-containing protein [Geodermatophilus sp. SYSU D00814]